MNVNMQVNLHVNLNSYKLYHLLDSSYERDIRTYGRNITAKCYMSPTPAFGRRGIKKKKKKKKKTQEKTPYGIMDVLGFFFVFFNNEERESCSLA